MIMGPGLLWELVSETDSWLAKINFKMKIMVFFLGILSIPTKYWSDEYQYIYALSYYKKQCIELIARICICNKVVDSEN